MQDDRVSFLTIQVIGSFSFTTLHGLCTAFNIGNCFVITFIPYDANGWLTFAVYPVLSPKGQKEWEQIEEALYREELTIQGYNKYRRALFQKENLIPHDRTEKEKQKDEKRDMDAVEGALTSHVGDSNTEKNSTSSSKEECFKVN